MAIRLIHKHQRRDKTMTRNKRVAVLFVMVLLILALPVTALANKRIYKARLTTGAELHEVVGSAARGSAVFLATPSGMQFMIQVHGLSGAPWGAHIHAPATETQNAGVVVSLCGAPAPAAVATCTFDSDTGIMTVEGVITSSLLAQWGLPGATLFDYLDNGMAYVNVHTDLNPAGEVRGQIEARGEGQAGSTAENNKPPGPFTARAGSLTGEEGSIVYNWGLES
jgi:hypothetical protein